MLSQTPPHSIEIEQGILGCILLEGALLPAAQEIEPADFYNSDHQKIFQTFLDLHELGEPIDIKTMSTRINGKSSYLLSCTDQAITSARLTYYIPILKAYTYKRYILKYLLVLKSKLDANSPAEDLSDTVKEMQAIEFQGKKNRTQGIIDALRLYVQGTEGDFSGDEARTAVTFGDIGTKRDKVTERDKAKIYETVKKGLQRMKEKGEIQPVGKRTGIYRRVDTKAAEIEWWKADEGPIPVKYPMGVEEYVLTLPKNIIVIAGEPNAGKTAYLLNFTARNLENFPINYFSSEMGDRELKSRLVKFEKFPLENWRKANFQERSGNFVDVIRPDEINIIDFLEITQDFWIVAGLLKEIHDKLNKGICLVALQKNKGTDFGLGGQRGLEKPRLYISLGQNDKKKNICKIVKGKNWAKEDVNPNGLQIEFKLVQGYKFIGQTPWHKETDHL